MKGRLRFTTTGTFIKTSLTLMNEYKPLKLDTPTVPAQGTAFATKDAEEEEDEEEEDEEEEDEEEEDEEEDEEDNGPGQAKKLDR